MIEGMALGILLKGGEDDMFSIVSTCLLSIDFAINLWRGMDEKYPGPLFAYCKRKQS